MGAYQNQRTGTIANGQTTSSAMYLGDQVPIVLRMPAAFTGTSVTFEGSPDGVTFQEIDVGGTAYTETVAQGKDTVLDPTGFSGYRYVKVISGSAEGGARTVTLLTRKA